MNPFPIDATQEEWTPEAVHRVRPRLERLAPEDVLRWGFDTFGGDLALATGFGPSGVVLMHLTARLRPDATVFYLDTDLHFEETYRLRDELAARLGLTFTRVAAELTLDEQAAAHGPALWEREPDRCCALRKVLPLRRFLATRRAWATGLRRDQAATRLHTSVLEWDYANDLVKLNPLAHWTDEEIWAYIQVYELPYNALHDQGYPSIGCWPCTRPVQPGEDPRAGRWSGRAKTECGIHLQPGQAA